MKTDSCKCGKWKPINKEKCYFCLMDRIFYVPLMAIFNLISSMILLKHIDNLLIFIGLVSLSCIISTSIFVNYYKKAKKEIEINPENKTKIGLSFATISSLSMVAVHSVFGLISILYLAINVI